MDEKLEELKRRLIEVDDLQSAAALLNWDQTTYMPPGGAAARGRQLATLQQLAHEKFTDPTIGQLLDGLEGHTQHLSPDSDEASLVRIARRDYERAVKIPPSFMAEFTRHSTASYTAWEKARPQNDFSAVEPYLEKNARIQPPVRQLFPWLRAHCRSTDRYPRRGH